MVLVFLRCHVEEMARRRVAGKVLAGILTPLHVRVPVALGEVIAGHSEGWEVTRYLVVAVIDEVHGVLVFVFWVLGCRKSDLSDYRPH